MHPDLNEKRIVITGGTKGLGLRLVQAFIGEGSKVAFLARNVDGLGEAEKKTNAKGQSRGFIADVREDGQTSRAIRDAVAWLGGLDVLVNNAGGVAKFLKFDNLSDEDWLDAYKLNVLGIVHMVNHSLPHLINSSSPRIINIGSITALQPGIFNPHYSVAKAAALNLTKHLANTLAPHGILVNGILPGTFASDAWERNIHRVADETNQSLDAARESETNLAMESIPLGRLGKPDDITPLVLLLASKASAWTTGSCFVVDGGKHKGIH